MKTHESIKKTLEETLDGTILDKGLVLSTLTDLEQEILGSRPFKMLCQEVDRLKRAMRFKQDLGLLDRQEVEIQITQELEEQRAK